MAQRKTNALKPEDAPNALMAKFAESPYQALAACVGGIIVIGTLPLWLPIASLWGSGGRPGPTASERKDSR